MPFKSTIRIPSEVLDAIVSLTELTTAFAVQSALDTGRDDAPGAPAPLDGPLTAGTAMSGVRWGGRPLS